MEMHQALRLISVFAAIMAGFWLPLHFIDRNLPFAAEAALDLLISAASAINVYLYFQKTEQSPLAWRSWLSVGLLLDLACALPLALTTLLAWGVEPLPLLVLNLVTFRHIVRIKAFLDQFAHLQPAVYRLIPIFVVMPLLVHLVACGWVALGSGTAGSDPDRVLEYIRALYWAFTTLTTVGYGDIAAKTAPQMLFASFVQVLGVGVFGFVISNVAGILSRGDAAREHHMDNLDKVETYMRANHIPPELRGKIRDYYHYLWTHHKGYSDHALLEGLPIKIQSELFSHVHRSIIEKVSFLKAAAPEMIEDLMHDLEHRVIVPGEKIFRIHDIGDCLYLIHRGQIEILDQEDNILATLHEGAFFGEMALLSDKPRVATARATSYCDVYSLHKDAFKKVTGSYPEFKEHIEKVTADRRKSQAA